MPFFSFSLDFRCFVRLMDPGFLLINNFARLVAILGILISTPLFAWAGYLWMTSMGDPNRAAAARNAFISVGVGLVIIGCAFIIPAVIGESVVAPAGGLVYEQDSGVNCDGILREQLVANRQVSDADRINFIIKRIQEKFEDCTDFFWTPRARADSGHIGSCFDDPDTKDSISGGCSSQRSKKGGIGEEPVGSGCSEQRHRSLVCQRAGRVVLGSSLRPILLLDVRQCHGVLG